MENKTVIKFPELEYFLICTGCGADEFMIKLKGPNHPLKIKKIRCLRCGSNIKLSEFSRENEKITEKRKWRFWGKK